MGAGAARCAQTTRGLGLGSVGSGGMWFGVRVLWEPHRGLGCSLWGRCRPGGPPAGREMRVRLRQHLPQEAGLSPLL